MACSDANPPEVLRRAFEPSGDFEPLPEPVFGDWLSIRPEPGQTFEQFVRSKPNRPDNRRDTLYLQPLGEFPPGDSPSLIRLKELAEAFFAMDVRVRPTLDLSEVPVAARQNPGTGQRQLRTGDVIGFLQKRLPKDAFAMLGVTMEDLYPGPEWNFVFGQASLRGRVGIYSFARYDPQFYGEPRTGDWRKLMMKRSCKVLAHETVHMFGIPHCTAFRCLINGSNSLEEADSRPLHLCPVDLRKLHRSIGFDVVERYRRLLEFSESEGFDDEARWLRRRIDHITGTGQGLLR
ncbi:MAG TPA: archaemetzincin [Thermoanaerobaculia bacterium]